MSWEASYALTRILRYVEKADERIGWLVARFGATRVAAITFVVFFVFARISLATTLFGLCALGAGLVLSRFATSESIFVLKSEPAPGLLVPTTAAFFGFIAAILLMSKLWEAGNGAS